MPLPVAGLICPLGNKAQWLTRPSDGSSELVYRPVPEPHSDAEVQHLRDAIASLSGFYDVMMIDVAHARSVAAFHDLSDEVIIIGRERHWQDNPVERWLEAIGRAKARKRPLLTVRTSRAREVTDRDWRAWIRERKAEMV